MAASVTSRLDRRFNAHYDLTYSNMVVLILIDIETCPIKLEHKVCMVICNDQYYGFDGFDHYKTSEYKRINRRIDSGYNEHMKFEDPRIGK